MGLTNSSTIMSGIFKEIYSDVVADMFFPRNIQYELKDNTINIIHTGISINSHLLPLSKQLNPSLKIKIVVWEE